MLKFKNEEIRKGNLADKSRSDRPVTAIDKFEKLVEEMILENCFKK